MLFTTTLGAGTFAVTTNTVPTTPTSTPPTTFDLVRMVTKQPAVAPMPFTCTTDACTGTDAADFVFRLLQNLINMANAQLAKSGAAAAPIVVDGRLDKRTLVAYMPVSRGIGGTLAIFDFTPDPKYLATNAATFAQTIAQWLGLTWVEATVTVPGHWERLRTGQTSVLPTMPVSTTTKPTMPLPLPTQPPPTGLCPAGMVATSQGCLPTAPPLPPPPPPPPPPVMTMYVCPDGTRVSSPGACLAPLVTPPTSRPYICEACPPGTRPATEAEYQAGGPCCILTVVGPPLDVQTKFPGVLPPPARKRYAGCLARFNKTRKVFAIYCPIGTAPTTTGLAAYSGFSGFANEHFQGHYNNYGGLGADTVTPPVPANFIKTAETRTLPGEDETPAGEESDKFFRVNNPLMWALFAGTAAVVGGGSYFIVRRRKHH
jgi:hypothetical protein